MKRDKHRSVMLRYLILSIFILVVMAVPIVWNVVKNTVIDAPKWNAKATRELSASSRVINPERGDILACDGSVLATTLRYYTARIDFGAERFKWDKYVDSIPKLSDSLQRYFPLAGGAKAWIDSLRAPLFRNKKPRGWRLLHNINNAQVQKLRTFPFLNIRNPNHNGLVISESRRRRNPYGDMASRSVGVVSENAKTREVHGMSGLEKALDSLLYGVPGRYKKVNITRGIVDWVDTAAQRGYDILSTIDIKMQDIVENELNNHLEYCHAEWGVAVLMEVSTGEIKAISNLEEDRKHPMRYIEGMNRAVRGFEPGSVVKTLSMMIAVEDGLVRNLDSVIVTGGRFAYAGGKPITDSHFTASMTVADVIEQSSNIGMAKIITAAYDRKPSAWRERIARLGFLEKLGSGIGEERAPNFPRVKDDRGGRITLSRQSYGYATEIPPLHTLSIYNAIANGGVYVRPRLIRGMRNETVDSMFDVSFVRPRACSEATAEKMRMMLKRVVWGDHGTGRSLRSDLVALAGKTGTCYMIDTLTHKYNTAHKRLAFCGYFPADDPKYSCIVLMAHPRQNAFGAASTSGTVMKRIAEKMYSRGMLGNKSDFRSDSAAVIPGSGTGPTFYSSALPERIKTICRTLGIADGSARRLASPADVKSGSVPDVVGLGLREAVARLESHGFNVAFTGAGYVAFQSPVPASAAARGSVVNLTLRE